LHSGISLWHDGNTFATAANKIKNLFIVNGYMVVFVSTNLVINRENSKKTEHFWAKRTFTP
jgi:hypothetical protein